MKNSITQITEDFIKKIGEIFKESEKLYETEERIKLQTQNLATSLVELFIEQIDNEILRDKKKRKAEGYSVERRGDKRSILFSYGQVEFERTYYKKASGGYEYLADAAVGINERDRISENMLCSLATGAKDMSYAKASRHITGGKISRQTVMNCVRESRAEITESTEKRAVSELHIDADEAHVTLIGGNGKNYIGKTADELKNVRSIYQNHEIACHTLSHDWPSRMPNASLVTEIMRDREILEKISGYPVTGMSYPSGSYNSNVISVMNSCGIEYSRTVNATNDFDLPEDFLEWNPSCHFKSAMPLAEIFLRDIDSEWAKPLFYIWGHSHEIRNEDDWEETEQLLRLLANNNKIWYATNIEIFDYISAQKMLKISADERIFYNPTATDLWVEKDKAKIIKIPAGTRIIAD